MIVVFFVFQKWFNSDLKAVYFEYSNVKFTAQTIEEVAKNVLKIINLKAFV